MGRVTPQVRDRLWQRATRDAKGEACVLLYENPGSQQGLTVVVHGDRDRELIDHEGLTVARLPLRDGDRTRIASTARTPPP